jgi:predicted nucleic acid-binding protein
VRIVLDSSVLVAALATPNPSSASRIVLAAAAAGVVRLVISDDLEAEYRRAVEYPRVARCSPRVDRQAFVSKILDAAERVEPGAAAGAVPSDADDDKVMAAAFGGAARYVLSLDRHLLDLRESRGVKVVTPGAFLDVLRASGFA